MGTGLPLWARRADGSEFPVDIMLSPIEIEQRRLVLAVVRDITERKRSEEALRRSETRLRQVLATETVGVLFLDKDGTIIDSNTAFLRMTGYSRAEVDAHELTWRKLTPPEWVAVTEEQMGKLEASGLIEPYEKEYLRKDGSRCWMLFTGRMLDDGTIAEYCIDISDRKRAEQERELLASELSHRVKNTLAVPRQVCGPHRGPGTGAYAVVRVGLAQRRS
jgi:PAS domain S-box-containing protein